MSSTTTSSCPSLNRSPTASPRDVRGCIRAGPARSLALQTSQGLLQGTRVNTFDDLFAEDITGALFFRILSGDLQLAVVISMLPDAGAVDAVDETCCEQQLCDDPRARSSPLRFVHHDRAALLHLARCLQAIVLVHVLAARRFEFF